MDIRLLISGGAKKAGDVLEKFITQGHSQSARITAEADSNTLMIGVSLVVRALTD
jgi:hypothetical protein